MNLFNRSKIVILDNNLEYAESLVGKLKFAFPDCSFKIFTRARDLFDSAATYLNISDVVDSVEDIYNNVIDDYEQYGTLHQQLLDCEPTLFVLDFNLGEASSQNGIGISRMLKKHKANSYTILLTNFANHQTGCDAQNRKHIDGFVAKDTILDQTEVMLSRDDIFQDIAFHIQHARNNISYERINEFNNIQSKANALTKRFISGLSIKSYYYIDSIGSCYAKSDAQNFIFKVQERQIYEELKEKYNTECILFNAEYSDIGNHYCCDVIYSNNEFVAGFKDIT